MLPSSDARPRAGRRRGAGPVPRPAILKATSPTAHPSWTARTTGAAGLPTRSPVRAAMRRSAQGGPPPQSPLRRTWMQRTTPAAAAALWCRLPGCRRRTRERRRGFGRLSSCVSCSAGRGPRKRDAGGGRPSCPCPSGERSDLHRRPKRRPPSPKHPGTRVRRVSGEGARSPVPPRVFLLQAHRQLGTLRAQ